MKINKIKINGFGKFINKEINFADGMNLIYGKNEAGKSTVQNYIKASLFGFPNQHTDGEGRLPDKTKYKPWDSAEYGGMSELTSDNGKKIRVERNFETGKTKVFDENLTEITSDFDYQSRKGLKVGEKLFGFDRDCFENSVFIGQGSTTVNQGNRNHLFEKIVNLMNTGTEDASTAKAKSALSDAARNMGNGRTKNRPYNKALADVSIAEEKLTAAKEKNAEMTSKIQRKAFLEAQLEQLEKQIKIAETAQKSEILYEKLKSLELTKKRFMSIKDEIDSLEKTLYEDKNKYAALNIKNAKESDVLDFLQKTASSAEKQKRIPEGNHAAKIEGLKNNQSQRKLIIIVSLVILLLSIPAGIFIKPFLFSLTAFAAVTLLIFFMKKPTVTATQLEEYMGLEKECNQALQSVNTFLINSGKSNASDFEQAQVLLNSLYNEINEKTSLGGIIKNKQDRIDGQKELADEILGDYESIGDLNKEISALSSMIEQKNTGVNTVTKSLSDLKTDQLLARDELAGVKRLIDEYVHDDNQLAELEEQLASAVELLDNIETETTALALAEEFIVISAESLRKNIFPVINEKMSGIISKLTNGRHSQLLAGLGKTMNTEYNDNARTIWNFSDGTIDQMYLSLRLAAADAMSEKESLPVFIDEAFAYYDEDRIQSAFELLYDISKNHQIIIFTCKESELDIARSLSNVNIIEL